MLTMTVWVTYLLLATPSGTSQSDLEVPPEHGCQVENHCTNPIKAEEIIEMLSDTTTQD